jgi:hypothetical protein
MTSGVYQHKSHSIEQNQKISDSMKGRNFSESHRKNLSKALTGKHLSPETKKKLSIFNTGKVLSKETKRKVGMTHLGNKYCLGKRYKRKKTLEFGYAEKQKRNDSAYKYWRKNVYERDGFKCKIKNKDCKGIIEAHHILGWSDHPELRYKINNGITLCHAHHPRKRAEEKRLIPVLQILVSVSKDII